ncbi:MAG: hypothetical protein JWL83_2332 [Actinomycetia bacterium]|jgi:hypothetical protein|nr:hypothetical protein [Actinomycetes bacterium]
MFLAFAVGYVFGTKTGTDNFAELVQAARAIRESEEFDDFMLAVRDHVAHSLRGVADMIEKVDIGSNAAAEGDLVDRVRQLVSRG